MKHPYSKEWFHEVIGSIQGVNFLLVKSNYPGEVHLTLGLEDGADQEVIHAELIKRMEADKGLIFKCTATLHKSVKTISLNDFKS